MKKLLILLVTVAAWAQQPQVEVATTVAFTEGPAVDAQGNVFFTDTQNHRIMRLSTDGALAVFREHSNGANGLIFDDQWRLIACEASDRVVNRPRVTRTDLTTGRVEILAEQYEGKRFNGPNDVTLDNQGRIYFTDPNWGEARPGRVGINGVYRIVPGGNVTRILAEPDIQRPNGITISPDGRTLYLVEANRDEGGARMIRAYDLRPDGAVRNMRVHYNFYPGRSADGISIDTEGNVYAAAGLNRPRGTSETLDTKAGIHVISPEGRRIQFFPIPEDTITNCAFGGPGMKTLYVTAGKTLFKVKTQVAGTRR